MKRRKSRDRRASKRKPAPSEKQASKDSGVLFHKHRGHDVYWMTCIVPVILPDKTKGLSMGSFVLNDPDFGMIDGIFYTDQIEKPFLNHALRDKGAVMLVAKVVPQLICKDQNGQEVIPFVAQVLGAVPRGGNEEYYYDKFMKEGGKEKLDILENRAIRVLARKSRQSRP